MQYKTDWYKTRQRFEAFWEGEIVDRCCIGLIVPGKNHILKSEKQKKVDLTKASPEEKIRFWTDGEYILKRKIEEFENTYYAGDAFPQIFLNLGAAGHAGYFKNAKYRFEDSVWFFEWIKDIEKDKIEFDPNSFLYKKTIELAQYFCDQSNDRYFVSMPDNSGNLDALAHMRGSINLLMDLYDNREWIKDSLEKIQRVTSELNDKVFQIIQKNNDGGSCIGWLNTWSPGRHSQMQSDISVMISPEDYRDLVIPELKLQSSAMTNSLYHFDGVEQISFLDMLLEVDTIDAIQWTCVAGQSSPVDYLPVLKKIQKAGKKLVIPYCHCSDIEILLSELSSKGLLIYAYAGSQDQADQIIRLASTLTHE